MTDLEALDEAVRRTGVQRYAYLCSPANTLPPPNDPATWRRYMHVLAGAEPPPAPPRPIHVDYGVGEAGPCGGCP